jgi:hypothetical protein
MVRGRPGPAPQTAKREWFARLIAQGVPSAQACRMVGVNPRTGNGGDTGARSPAAAAGGCTIRR